MKKLTIAMPVYERTDFFEGALKSAIDQTYPVEIIVVDNGSSHNKFKEIIQAQSQSNIKYYRNERNLGMYGNWNKCIEYCETEFLIIFGDDDFIDPEFSAKFHATLEAHPDIKCFHTDIERFGDKVELETGRSRMPVGYHSGIGMLKYAAREGLGIWTVAMAFAKSVYPTYKFQYPAYQYSQDWLFTYQAFANESCYGLPEKLIRYRVHSTGNAIKVGIKAYLSAVLIYSVIAEKLQEKREKVAAYLAQQQAKGIIYSCLTQGNKSELEQMVLNPDNPFGKKITELILGDRLLSLMYKSTYPYSPMVLFAFRLIGKVNYLFNTYFIKYIIEKP